MRDRLTDIVRDLVYGRAGLLLLCGQIQKQTFAQRRAERINGDKFSLRVFFPQFVAGDRTGLIRCAQSGGKPMKRISRPSFSFPSMTAVNSETLTALVVARSPLRSLS